MVLVGFDCDVGDSVDVVVLVLCLVIVGLFCLVWKYFGN